MEEIDDPEVLALTSPSFADVRIDFGMARAEIAAEVAARQTAELWAAIADVLEDAERHPEVFIDDRAQLSARDRREYAVRSATADLAVRLSVAESSVRMWGDAARALRRSAPTVWVAFTEGRVSSANARTVADTVATLPSEAHARFVESIGDAAELALIEFVGADDQGYKKPKKAAKKSGKKAAKADAAPAAEAAPEAPKA